MTVQIDKTLEDHITACEHFSSALWTCTDGITFTKTRLQTDIVLAYFTLALEHFSAVIVLVKAGLHASAHALLRPIHEAYIRGRWLHLCATDEELSKAIVNEKFPETLEMVKQIEQSARRNETIEKTEEPLDRFTTYHKSAWKIMNSYTHGGQKQILNRITQTDVQSNFKDEQIIAGLNTAVGLALLTSTAISQLLLRDDIAVSIYKKYQEIFKE
jgi:hypothetical protein